MVKKKCPKCCQESYSAAVSGKWFCPYCKADITLVPLDNINLAKISSEDKVRKPFPLKLFM